MKVRQGATVSTNWLFLIGTLAFVLGTFGVYGLIPFPAQAAACIQSVVVVPGATVCPPPQTYIDSITFQGQVIGPVSSVPQVTASSGVLTAYYFPAAGVTITSISGSWCVWNLLQSACTTSMTALTVSNNGVVNGEGTLTANSPTLVAGTSYEFVFKLTDSVGTTSTQNGFATYVTTASQTPNFVATASWIDSTCVCQLNGAIGSNPTSSSVVTAFNTITGTAMSFTVSLSTNQGFVGGVLLSVSGGGPTGQMTPTQYGVYSATITINTPGTYTITGTIQGNSLSLTPTLGTFSVRVSAFVVTTSTTITSITSSSATYTFTNTLTSCYITTVGGTTTIVSGSTTVNGGTASQTCTTTGGATTTCTATGCTITSTFSSCNTAGCSTTTVVTTTSGVSTTSITIGVGGPPIGKSWLAFLLLISSFPVIALAIWRKGKNKE